MLVRNDGPQSQWRRWFRGLLLLFPIIRFSSNTAHPTYIPVKWNIMKIQWNVTHRGRIQSPTEQRVPVLRTFSWVEIWWLFRSSLTIHIIFIRVQPLVTCTWGPCINQPFCYNASLYLCSAVVTFRDLWTAVPSYWGLSTAVVSEAL